MNSSPHLQAPHKSTPLPETMTAVVARSYGGPEVMAVATVPRPSPRRGQVLVEVCASAIDRGTEHLLYGRPWAVRPAFGVRRPRQPIPGRDLAGTVVAVGDDVHEFAVGDEVVGTGSGSLAQYAVAPAARLAHRPAALEPVAAATIPVSGLTALQAVREVGQVRPGQSVLVLGASGGVGTYAVQVAVALGAQVTGVCSAAKMPAVRDLGAAVVLDYATDDPVNRAERYDLVIDIGGSRPLRALRQLVHPRGTLVMVGAEGDGRWLGGVDRLLRAAIWSPFVSQRIRMLTSKERGDQVAELVDMVATGRITPVVDSTYPLAQAADAMRRLASGEVTGKIAMTVT